jgi:hypothetical protein
VVGETAGSVAISCRPSASKAPMRFSSLFILSTLVLVGCVSGVSAVEVDWQTSVDPLVRGTAATSRPARLKYGFGWNGIVAASGDVRLTKTSGDRIQFTANGGTIGIARALWKYDVNHLASIDAQTLRPLHIKEVSDVRSNHVRADLTFTPEGVTSIREETNKGKVNSKTRAFEFPKVQSVTSALLYLRTLPLTDGAVHRVVVYPETSGYLCTVTVVGRDQVTVPTGTHKALKLNVRVDKIAGDRELQPHKKVKKTTVWLSDDADRVVLRIEAQIFVGTVFAELQSLEFDDAQQ